MPLPVRNTPNQIYYSQDTGSLSRAIFENAQFWRGKKFKGWMTSGFTLLCVIFVPNIPVLWDLGEVENRDGIHRVWMVGKGEFYE